MAVSGTGLAAILAGSVFVYAGIKGKSVLGTVQAVVSGKDPKTAKAANKITAPAEPGGAAPSPVATGGNAGSRGTYDHAELVTLWITNGGDPNEANNAACHGMQESGGNPRVTSANPDGGTNVGLWQLDTRGKGAGYTVAQLQDPTTNVRITIMQTRNGRDWSAWATPGC